tara:strand:- start:76 stop:1053 length:978 start_codon:yes stop_codon:yes gene_type:complete
MSFDTSIKNTALAALKRRFNSLKGGDELAAMDIPEPPWLIKDILPLGLTVLGGPKKLGKSYLVIQFAKQIVEQGHPVFYFAGEDSYHLHKLRQKQVGLEATSEYQFVAGRKDYFSSPDKFYDNVSEVLSMYPFKAVFIDVMEHCLKPAQVRDYSYYMNELGRWAKLAQHYEIALVMVTHTGKNAGQNYSDPMDHIIGSTGITSAADWILAMQKSEDGQGATLHSEGKMAAAKTFSLVKRNGIFYEIDGLERDRLIQRKTAQNEILECIKANSGIKQWQIVEKLNKQKQNVSRDIIKLLKTDYITGNPNDGYFAVISPDYPDDTDD